MKALFGNKRLGFYVSAVACVLTLIGLILYGSAANQLPIVRTLLIIVLAVEALAFILSLGKFRPFLNLSMPICAVLMAAMLILSFSTQLDALGYAVAGLYTMDQVMPFIRFAAVAAVAFLLFIVSSFMQYGRQE